MKYVRYAGYLLAHKWRVFRAAPRYGVPLWQALIHDWSRVFPSEFIPAAEYLYGRFQAAADHYRYTPGEYPPHDRGRALHELRNPHHASYWQGRPMPEKYIREMLADWDAAGSLKGNDMRAWYAANRNRLGLHPLTLARIDEVLHGDAHGYHHGALDRRATR